MTYSSPAVTVRGEGDRERLDGAGSSLTGDGEAVRWRRDDGDFFHGSASSEECGKELKKGVGRGGVGRWG
jgi:hypothetical protein